MIAETWKS